MSPGPAIQVESLCKSFRRVRLKRDYTTLKSLLLRPAASRRDKPGRIEVLKGLDLRVEPGEMVGLIGRNGSGKSTLLKIMAGIYKPSRGRVVLRGRVSSLIELGAGFHPDFSGRENIFLNGTILGLRREEIQARFENIVRFAELEEFIDTPVRTYSSGMYVRLGFSVAVNVDPDILLVDEVLAVGDEAFSHKCEDKINEFKRAGKTILLVTHDLNAVERFCQRAVWLEAGLIQAAGEPLKVIDAYRQFVAQREDAEMTSQARPENQASDRWGDGQATLTEVSVLDQTGRRRGVFGPGEGLRVRLSYRLRAPIEDIVFGVALAKADGGLVYGVNTGLDRLEIKGLPLEGEVECLFQRQDLTDGTYFVDAAAHARDGRAYDYWTRCASFAVRSGLEDAGVYRLPHEWKLP